MAVGKTLVEKIWDAHRIAALEGGVDLLHIDRVVLHERSGGRMIDGVLRAGRRVRSPDSVFATIDHIIDTHPGRTDKTKFPGGEEFIGFFRDNAEKASVEIFDIDDERQGIVHVMAPELGIAQPGLTIVCGDSHTATLGGVGALAWGIGVTQGEHALSTRCLPVKRPNQVLINLEGTLPEAVFAKDIVLRLSAAQRGSVTKADAVEFAGSAIRAMSVEGRMTLCNMAVEFGCWTAVVAPDEKTHDYLRNGRYAPKGKLWEQAVAHWSALKSDGDAKFHKVVSIDVSGLRPQVTWGTSSDHVVSIDGAVPLLSEEADATKREAMRQAMEYMGLPEGTGLRGLPIEAAFIGSCTNGRIEDLRAAAEQLRGRRVGTGIKALCVPGSAAVKRQAQAEELDELFKDAGFEWREPGCSLCFYAGGETFGANKRVISTTNRSFQNRQGPGVKTHLASPATVAASAVAGRIVPPSPSR